MAEHPVQVAVAAIVVFRQQAFAMHSQEETTIACSITVINVVARHIMYMVPKLFIQILLVPE